MLRKFQLDTPREGFINITSQVREAIAGIDSGICVVFCPHTTAAITINENADPDVTRDLTLGLNKAFPDRPEFKHSEGNSHAHLKSSCVGVSETLIIEQGHLVLGTWQSVYFCEFDGPRKRSFYVKAIKD
ncbi:MAG: secondary thiamine-phosphate synthase enzyme YjbQ [Clostridiales bacterium]|jgi:secondary thiamine-phosphate synthase enzyme|nr:secondary thiamine-phosphate synthase enzyme YjbQ [Clostridiales bacterium]